MKIAIIGTGQMGRALLTTFYKHSAATIYFSGRDPSLTQKLLDELALNLQAVNLETALQADIIIPALWFKDLLAWASLHEMQLNGKILIDITNPFNETFDDFTTAFDSSAAEELQHIIPGTKVVGAFKNTYQAVFDRPVLQGLKSDIYVTSDSEDSIETVMGLLKPLPFRVLNGGRLKNNRTIERMTLLARELSLKAGNYPRIAFNLWGLEH